MDQDLPRTEISVFSSSSCRQNLEPQISYDNIKEEDVKLSTFGFDVRCPENDFVRSNEGSR